MNKEIVQPLRHGWGGDKKKRAHALREKADEMAEQVLFPEKYADRATPLDMELLKLLQLPRE